LEKISLQIWQTWAIFHEKSLVKLYFSGCPKIITGPNRHKKKKEASIFSLMCIKLQNGVASRESGS